MGNGRFGKLARDPLTHFLMVGAILYAASAALAPAGSEKEIVVDRAALLEFIQYRSKAFEADAAAALLDDMSEARREKLVRDYVEEEVMYREAKALGLDRDDYVIKQRLVRKLGFIAEAAAGSPKFDDDDVAAYYEAHRDDYRIAPSATFTHVFFDADERGAAAAEQEAANLLPVLTAQETPFEDAVRYGDRFPFHVNYVERTFDYVSAQFGEAAARKIFATEGPFNVWRGPYTSSYGAHLVLVRDVAPGGVPPLAAVRSRGVEDVRRARQQALVDDAIAQTVSEYRVIMDFKAPTARKQAAVN